MTWGNIYTKRVNWPVKPRNAHTYATWNRFT